MIFQTLNVRRETAVLFVEISAPPMNLEGPELVRDLVSLIQQAEADEVVQVIVFKSADPDYFISHVDVTKIKENRAEAAKLNGVHQSANYTGILAPVVSSLLRRSKVAYAESASGFQSREAEMDLAQLVSDIQNKTDA